jgi:L-threonylcarbamoyladenylate synthase
MYKVFIENREVNFRNQSSTLQSNGVIYAKSNESFEKTLLNRILETPENTVVTVLCDSVKKVWKNVLSDCKFIQAAGGIVQREDEFLFIERNNLWDIPKGKLESGESIEIAAQREIEEECGINELHINELICITYHTYFFKNKWHLKETHWFHFLYNGSKQTVCQAEEGITNARWFKRHEFSIVESKTYQSIQFVVNQFLKLYDENIELQKAVQVLTSRDCVAIPTETVYGLAANALSIDAVAKIFELKNRPQTNPLIVHCGSIQQVEQYVSEFPLIAKNLAKQFWPGPLTLLLPKNDKIPDQITAGSNRVGVRIPNHPLTLKLLNKLDFPIAAPSANKYGSVSPTRAEHVKIQFGDQVPLILDGGECNVGIESTIVGFEENEVIIYRLGQITAKQIEKVCGQKANVKNNADEIIMAPGMVKHHYAPKTLLKIVNGNEQIKISEKSGVILFNEQKIAGIPFENQIILAENDDLEEASRKLYGSFYQLDKLNLDVIYMKEFPSDGIGKSLNDRIQRAGMKS